jgi:copper resistance protein B
MRFLVVLLIASLSMSALAQHEDHGAEEAPSPQTTVDPHAGHYRPITPRDTPPRIDPHAAHQGHQHDHQEESAASVPAASPPPEAFSGPAHAADRLFDPRQMAGVREQLLVEHGGMRTYMILADRFETRHGDGSDSYLWDLSGWYGGDIHKLRVKSEGEGDLGNSPDHAEIQALYSRAVTPFVDLQAGIRHDIRPDPQRSHLALGLQGHLPYLIEIDALAYVSNKGHLTGRVEAEYDLWINQRLILQPRLELNVAAQEIGELGLGSGLGSVKADIRLRYEIRREFAPYIGVGWEQKLGDTAAFARTAGHDEQSWDLVLGIRWWH